mgnify:CR=1 FL=1
MIIKNAVIIVAAGRGHRMEKQIPKQYLDIGGMAVLRHTVNIFLKNPAIDHIQVVIHPDDQSLYDDAIGDMALPDPVFGGQSRQQSVLAGLEAISEIMPEYVYIHDAARPFLEQKTLNRLIAEVAEYGAVIPALNVTDTIKYMSNETIDSTLDRDLLYRAQTPQAFRYKAIYMAHRHQENKDLTDDSAVAELSGLKVRIIPGSENNFKITTPQDLIKAQNMSQNSYTDVRTGYGIDVHAFDKGDHIILGGIKIPHTHKLKGHSDADVALHALCDALLGALALGDIGDHFPPSDDQWKGASSDIFLKHAAQLIYDQDGVIANIDLTIICEQPKIAPHREKIRDNISQLLDLDINRVSIKATTTEKLGFTGKKQGIMAQAIATIRLPE